MRKMMLIVTLFVSLVHPIFAGEFDRFEKYIVIADPSRTKKDDGMPFTDDELQSIKRKTFDYVIGLCPALIPKIEATIPKPNKAEGEYFEIRIVVANTIGKNPDYENSWIFSRNSWFSPVKHLYKILGWRYIVGFGVTIVNPKFIMKRVKIASAFVYPEEHPGFYTTYKNDDLGCPLSDVPNQEKYSEGGQKYAQVYLEPFLRDAQGLLVPTYMFNSDDHTILLPEGYGYATPPKY